MKEIDWGLVKESVGHALRRATVVLAQYYARTLRRIGLTPIQIGTLDLIARNGGLSQKQVARLIVTDPSVVAGAASKLESLKLLTRSRAPHDRRNYILLITKRGRKILDACHAAIEKAERELVSPLQRGEAKHLLLTLHRICRFAETTDSSPRRFARPARKGAKNNRRQNGRGIGSTESRARRGG